ncbi:hypothetical protein [Pseudomonas paeninsulae]|uniref:hypothetical protein n=1 Tax=Pseudomonas paeninsulae TaxID=3110772 RepID=UPI002D7A21CD|nr:hypothetical protein [Pseudomonas sp. IT1137]
MSMLDNAVASIRLGVEDYQAAAEDDARALSAIRNLTAGLLLLFKVKLQNLSPPGSKESLLKQYVTPKMGIDGNPIWVGTGGKTVDVHSIIQRLKGLGVNDVDWTRLEALTTLRNDVEHYFSPHPSSVLLEAMEASFHLIQQFAPQHLGISPLHLLGGDVWTFLTEQNAFYKHELHVCQEASRAISWPLSMLAESARGLRCSSCRSELVKPQEPVAQPTETRFECTRCGSVATYEEAVESILATRYFRDLYLTATQGGEPPLERCFRCKHRTYIVDDAFCALCQENSPELGCLQCGGELENVCDINGELDRLCEHCRYVSEMD